MSKFKKAVLDTSLFRRSYVICLFCSNISFALIPAYLVLVFLFNRFWMATWVFITLCMIIGVPVYLGRIPDDL